MDRDQKSSSGAALNFNQKKLMTTKASEPCLPLLLAFCQKMGFRTAIFQGSE
jgi:hypothetical protein